MRKDKKIKQQKHKSKMQYRKKYDFLYSIFVIIKLNNVSIDKFIQFFCFNGIILCFSQAFLTLFIKLETTMGPKP